MSASSPHFIHKQHFLSYWECLVPSTRMDTSISFIILCLINAVSPDGETEGLTLGGLYPYNLTINHLSPRSVEVVWDCKSQNLHDKYEVTLKPLEASYRVIETVPYNTCYLLMDKLEPNTNYQVSVTSIAGRVRKRSSSVIFRTFIEDYREEDDEDEDDLDSSVVLDTPRVRGPKGTTERQSKGPRVRLVEISLVGMALVLWAGAIVLFFHRWGKIRMLLPYQPDYKEMKRNNSVCANCSMTPHHQCCSVHLQQQLQCQGGGKPSGSQQGPSTSTHQLYTAGQSNKGSALIDTGCSPIRPRLHSFITFDLAERCFGDRNEMLWMKSKSAEQLQHHSPTSRPSSPTIMDTVIDDPVPSTDF